MNGSAGGKNLSDIDRAIIDAIESAGAPVTPKEISNLDEELNYNYLRQRLPVLVDRGVLAKNDRGYGLPERMGIHPSTQAAKEKISNHDESGPASLLNDQATLTVYTEVKAAAGEGRVVYPDEAQRTVEVPKHFISRLIGFSVPSTVGIHLVEGDSMHPTIQEDDLVLYKPTEEVRGGGIYVLLIDGGLAVKRIEKIPGGGYKIISDNEYDGYPNYTLVPRDENGALVNQETGRTVDLRVVGSVIFPRRETDTLHVKQVAEIIKSVAGGGEVNPSQLR